MPLYRLLSAGLPFPSFMTCHLMKTWCIQFILKAQIHKTTTVLRLCNKMQKGWLSFTKVVDSTTSMAYWILVIFSKEIHYPDAIKQCTDQIYNTLNANTTAKTLIYITRYLNLISHCTLENNCYISQLFTFVGRHGNKKHCSSVKQLLQFESFRKFIFDSVLTFYVALILMC